MPFAMHRSLPPLSFCDDKVFHGFSDTASAAAAAAAKTDFPQSFAQMRPSVNFLHLLLQIGLEQFDLLHVKLIVEVGGGVVVVGGVVVGAVSVHGYGGRAVGMQQKPLARIQMDPILEAVSSH